jgi:hypothetical protein
LGALQLLPATVTHLRRQVLVDENNRTHLSERAKKKLARTRTALPVAKLCLAPEHNSVFGLELLSQLSLRLSTLAAPSKCLVFRPERDQVRHMVRGPLLRTKSRKAPPSSFF